VPNLDWGHVLHHLNLLDAGSAEKLLLTDRNGDAMMLTRYVDLKRSVELGYEELLRRQHDGLDGAPYPMATDGQQSQQFSHVHAQPQQQARRSVLAPLQ
jgi:hypothetical protein